VAACIGSVLGVCTLHCSLTQSTSEQCNVHTPIRVSPANFDTIHFASENHINTVLDTLLFITDLLIYVATSPTI
jgi:hypothetical protein